ncbi:MAG: transglycosylase SLT domain-containing protein [Dehalococcoidia bacterium]
MTPPETLAFGAELLLAGLPVEAIAHLDASESEPLEPLRLVWLARALSTGGQAERAATVWQQLAASPSDGGEFQAEALEELARAAGARGDVAGERQWLEQLAGVQPSPRVYARLASLQEASGDIDGARLRVVALLSTFPRSREALEAVEGGRYVGDPALAGVVLYRHGRLPEAEAALRTTEARTAATDYFLAAAVDDQGRDGEAVALYDAVSGESAYGHRARWWAARAMEDVGDGRSAVGRYREIAANGGSFAREAAFRAGTGQFRAGEFAEAAATWDLLAPSDAEAGLWALLARRAAGEDVAPALATFAALHEGEIAGVLARAELGQRALPEWHWQGPVATERMNWSLQESTPPGAAAEGLIAVGWRDEARTALERHATGGPAARRGALAAALAAGLVDLAPRLAAGRPGQDAFGPEQPLLLFPLGYLAQLNAAASEFGVSPLLLAALVRQESLWGRQAVSPAEARGLTQVIPPTAFAIAEALGHTMFHVEQLDDPGTSLRFGAYYLRVQLDRFGSPVVALAAYNAGPGNAARWAGEGPSLAGFLSAIDFEETRDYVERVVENWLTYGRLYAR